MKKFTLFFIFFYFIFNIEGNAYAEVINLKCSEYKGYGDYKKSYVYPNNLNFRIDTDKKTYEWKTSAQSKWTKMVILEWNGTTIKAKDPDPAYDSTTELFDFANLKMEMLEGNKKRKGHMQLICKNEQVAKKPEKKKPKPSPDDNKIVAAGSGSGFIVSKDGTVITNYHVIEGCELNKVTYKGSQLEAKVLSIDKVNDIAILKTNINSDTAFAVSNEDVSLLEDVVVAGFPLGKQISSAIKTHKGVVTALAGAGDNYSFFQTDAAINQGNSGGPIINQKGNVIGIAVQTWVEEGVQGVHFGIKSSTLKTFASANGLKFLAPNNRDLSNKELGKLITESTVYVECHMTIANIKKMIAEEENKKAFFSEYK